VGVDVVGLVDIKDTLFETDATMEEDPSVEGEGRKLSFSDLMNLVLDLRGGNTATVRDIVNLRKYIHGRLAAMEQKLAKPSCKSICFDESCQNDMRGSAAEIISHGLKLGAAPKFKDIYDNLHGLLSAHAMEMAKLEVDNQKMKERIAQMESDACRSLLSKACVVCKDLDDLNASETFALPCDDISLIHPPREPAAELCRERSLMTVQNPQHVHPYEDECQEQMPRALRATADGSAADFARHGTSIGTDAEAGAVGARGSPAAFSFYRGPAAERPGSQTATKRASTAVRNAW